MGIVSPAQRAASPGGVNEIARVRAELAAAGRDIIDLSDSNPTRHGLLPPGVLPAVAAHAPDAARYEPHPRGLLSARVALAARFGGEPGDYWLTESTSQAYSWLLTLLADPGEAVAVPEPGYPLVDPLARFAGVRTVGYRSHYVPADGWLLDESSMTTALADPTVRALVAVNPANPTGAYLGAAAVTLTDACARSGAGFIVDEVFAPFRVDGVDGGSLATAGPSAAASENGVPTFVLGGLSKLLCAPQLKLSWIRLLGTGSGAAAIRDGLDTIADAYLPVTAMVAAALPDLLALVPCAVATTRERLVGNIATARRVLHGDGFRVRQCAGGWTALVDVPRAVASPDLAVRLLRQAGLAVHPGWFYDLPDDTVIAVSLLPETERFADGMRRLRTALEELA